MIESYDLVTLANYISFTFGVFFGIFLCSLGVVLGFILYKFGGKRK